LYQICSSGSKNDIRDEPTGEIGHEVARYMRDHGHDLEYYRTNCTKIGPPPYGKLLLYCRDVYHYYLNLTVLSPREFLKNMLINAYLQATNGIRV